MNGSNNVEKIGNGKPRKAWNEDTSRKVDKRNKTKRNRDEKRFFAE